MRCGGGGGTRPCAGMSALGAGVPVAGVECGGLRGVDAVLPVAREQLRGRHEESGVPLALQLAPARAEHRLVRVDPLMVDVDAVSRGDEVEVERVALEGGSVPARGLARVLGPLDHRHHAEPQVVAVRRERHRVHRPPVALELAEAVEVPAARTRAVASSWVACVVLHPREALTRTGSCASRAALAGWMYHSAWRRAMAVRSRPPRISAKRCVSSTTETPRISRQPYAVPKSWRCLQRAHAHTRGGQRSRRCTECTECTGSVCAAAVAPGATTRARARAAGRQSARCTCPPRGPSPTPRRGAVRSLAPRRPLRRRPPRRPPR